MTTVVATDLKPCPFCGCKEILIKTNKTVMVECRCCGVVVFDYRDGVQRDPKKAWNQRKPLPNGFADMAAGRVETMACVELVEVLSQKQVEGMDSTMGALDDAH